jgi:hypothetical protein
MQWYQFPSACFTSEANIRADESAGVPGPRLKDFNVQTSFDFFLSKDSVHMIQATKEAATYQVQKQRIFLPQSLVLLQ